MRNPRKSKCAHSSPTLGLNGYASGPPVLLVGPHGHAHFEQLLAPARAHAAHRRRRHVIAPDGEAAVALVGVAAMRNVDADPAFVGDPHIGPRVARGLKRVARVEIAADVTRGHAGGTTTGDEQM